MKTIRTLILFLFLIAGGMTNTISAQEVTVAEPDTTSADLFYIVTESNDLKALPYEMGEIKTHKINLAKLHLSLEMLPLQQVWWVTLE